MDKQYSPTLYLGIDGGGSTCRARLRDPTGKLLGAGTSGPANLRLGLSQVTEQILGCTQDALAQAGMPSYPIKQLHAGLGLAGAVLEEDSSSVSPLCSHFATCQVSTDAYIACLGAHLGDSGAIIIVGTGSCAQVISPQLTRTFGGWGFDISDHASGAWLGQLALRDAVLAMEGLQPTTALSESIAAMFSHQPAEVLRWSQSAKPADYATLAPLVFSSAQAGNNQALLLIQRGCEQLVLLLQAVEQSGTGKVSLLGGLAKPYLAHLPDAIAARFCAAQSDALDGALLMAGLSPQALKHA